MELKPHSRSESVKRFLEPLRRVIPNLLILTAGSCVYAVGLNAVLIPKEFLSGGVVGVALIFHYLFPAINTGWIYFALNIPLMWMGWFNVSRKFFLYTIFGISIFSLATIVVTPGWAAIENPILSAVLAGIICGAGTGVILRSQGSTGGLDILAVYLSVKCGFRMGSTMSTVSTLVLAVGACFFGLERALYSLIYVYTAGKATDAVLTGFNQRKSILIISDFSEAIAEQILTRLHRGVTFLEGVGGYTGNPKRVILSITTLPELAKLKEIVFDIDPGAFVVINDTLEVLGKRHGHVRDY